MSIGHDAVQLKIDPANRSDFALGIATVPFGICRHSIGDVDVFRVDVHKPEKVLILIEKRNRSEPVARPSTASGLEMIGCEKIRVTSSAAASASGKIIIPI